MEENKSAGIIVTAKNTGKILLVKRSPKQTNYPNYWSVPSGHLEEGETYRQAAIRETDEETQINNLNDISFVVAIRNNHKRFEVFKATIEEQTDPTIDNEHSDFMWVEPNIDNFPRPIDDMMKKAIGLTIVG